MLFGGALVTAYHEGAEECVGARHVDTIAPGIMVVKPFSDHVVLRALRATKGWAVGVPDTESLEMMRWANRHEGLFLSPEGAATLAAVRRMVREGQLGPTSRALGELLANRLLDHFRPGEADVRARLGDQHVAERGERGAHASVGRVGEQDQRLAALLFAHQFVGRQQDRIVEHGSAAAAAATTTATTSAPPTPATAGKGERALLRGIPTLLPLLAGHFQVFQRLFQ